MSARDAFFSSFSPLFSDMGCHIDGFIAILAHTHVLQEGPVTGKAADVIAAANTAAEVALRLVRPGRKVVPYYFIPPLGLRELFISSLYVTSSQLFGTFGKSFIYSFILVLLCIYTRTCTIIQLFLFLSI